jgi:hypothetical protein
VTAAASPARAGAAFASAAGTAAAFISDGATVPAPSARAWSVRRLDDMFGGLTGWLAAPLARRLDAPVDVRGVAVWLALATAAPVDAAYIAAARAEWGYRLADLEPRLAARFTAAAIRLGYSGQQAERQWATLAKLATVLLPRGLAPGKRSGARGMGAVAGPVGASPRRGHSVPQWLRKPPRPPRTRPTPATTARTTRRSSRPPTE